VNRPVGDCTYAVVPLVQLDERALAVLTTTEIE
jgi:hypothetical protein